MVAHTVDMEQQKADDKEKRMKTIDKEIFAQLMENAANAKAVFADTRAGLVDVQLSDRLSNALGKETKALQLYLMKEIFMDMVEHRVAPALVLLENVKPPLEFVA